MQKSRNAIGVFDSGMGGLTVLRALRELLPHEHFIYLGDMARLPYGTKSADTVRQYASQMAKILIQQDVKALVIACNTASTAALTYLQDLYPALPIIGVIEPGAMAVASASKTAKIFVLATETTIASRAYHSAIEALIPGAKVEGRPSSLLVALAEEGMVKHDITRLCLAHYLEDFQDQDTILLGCTHFPVFKPLLIEMYPGVHIIDSAKATAECLKSILEQQELKQPMHDKGQVQYLVTDAISRFCRIGEIFLAETVQAEQVKLIDVV